MLVTSTTGIKSNWNPSVVGHNGRLVSQYHEFARTILSQRFSGYSLLEEVPIPGESLFFDFYIPMKQLAVEVHGIQHYKFVPHFHGDLIGFGRSKERDNRKREWCSINKVQLVELKYDEQDEWESQIINRD